MVKKATVVGAGVIGSAWAARFALHGVDVSIVDPNPETTRIIGEVFANARAAWSELELPPVTEGTVTVVDSIAEAVAEAHHVQESAPENLDMKREILAEIDQHAPPEVVVASSTSGIKPTDLHASDGSPGATCLSAIPSTPCISSRSWKYAAVNGPPSGRLLTADGNLFVRSR